MADTNKDTEQLGLLVTVSIWRVGEVTIENATNPQPPYIDKII